ncbi:MAG: SCO family protein [Gammaproteobacteria bacterium]
MRFKLIVAVVVILALGAGFWVASGLRGGELPATGAIVLDTPRDPGSFRLVDHHGQPFGPAEIRDQWTLWFFGFTHCPDICPMTLSALNLTDQALADAGAARPTVVMVSVDPQRDTPEKLAAYVPFFNDTFVGVTGTTAEVLTLTERLGIIVQYVARDGDDYTVEHGASLLLTGPDGLVRAVFTAPHEPQKLAQDLAVLIPWLEKNR